MSLRQIPATTYFPAGTRTVPPPEAEALSTAACSAAVAGASPSAANSNVTSDAWHAPAAQIKKASCFMRLVYHIRPSARQWKSQT